MSVWKQGDTVPAMVIDCFDGDGLRPDFTQAQEVKVIVTRRGSLVWERVPDSATSDGVVTVNLTPSDTATVGTFFVKVRAIWNDGSRQHYPPGDRYMTMTVTY